MVSATKLLTEDGRTESLVYYKLGSCELKVYILLFASEPNTEQSFEMFFLFVYLCDEVISMTSCHWENKTNAASRIFIYVHVFET